MEDLKTTLEEENQEGIKEESKPEAVIEEQEEGEQLVTSQDAISSEIVDVEWEQVERVFRGKVLSNQLETRLANMCVQFERAKYQLARQLSEIETFLYNEGSALKGALNIDPELTYELKLPANEGEKGFFIRKDS